jgi:membrane protease YdiL (CAAX protease family)
MLGEQTGDGMASIGGFFYDGANKRLGPLARGWLLWFERRDPPSYAAVAGIGLLLIFVVLEFVIGPRASIVGLLGLAPPPAWARIGGLLLLALVAVRFLARVKLRDAGFVPPWRWRAAESLYLTQVLFAAGAVFHVLRGGELRHAVHTGAWEPVALGLGVAMLWGFYQELVYRGILQTELSRRFGEIPGGLIANLAFTFGPLHFYHLANMSSPTSAAVMMASIFAIGLLFTFLYARTRNVWLVGLMHGVGIVFTSGVGQAAAG